MKPTIRITIDKSAFTDQQWARAQAKYPALDLQIDLEVKTYIQMNDGLVAERYLIVLEPDPEVEDGIITEVFGVGEVIYDVFGERNLN